MISVGFSKIRSMQQRAFRGRESSYPGKKPQQFQPIERAIYSDSSRPKTERAKGKMKETTKQENKILNARTASVLSTSTIVKKKPRLWFLTTF